MVRPPDIQEPTLGTPLLQLPAPRQSESIGVAVIRLTVQLAAMMDTEMDAKDYLAQALKACESVTNRARGIRLLELLIAKYPNSESAAVARAHLYHLRQPPTPDAAAESPTRVPNARPKKIRRAVRVAFSLIFVAGWAVWWFGGGLETQARHDLKRIEDQVASDEISQYRIASREGDTMQICVQAGMVSAAYLQAKDEDGYQQWKRIEEIDCRRAGLKR